MIILIQTSLEKFYHLARNKKDWKRKKVHSSRKQIIRAHRKGFYNSVIWYHSLNELHSPLA